jgi:hypothetical protein
MRQRIDEQFRLESARFELRFQCEDCALFDATSEQCSHGFPNAAHRCVDDARAHALIFCKEYELF